MPRAEAGSLKAISNQMKSKGLQRLRWYCQVCEKQCRDENGFKCHTMSESHVRNMQVVGSNAKSFIDQYSNDFLRDFLQLLRTSHGTKSVQLNQFYQSYIGNKSHVHMNSTKWKSLTELAKHLGREGVCRVEETDKGLHISWVDRSPEALRRQEDVRKRERQLQGDQQLEEKLIRQQIQRAQQAAEEAAATKAASAPANGDQTESLKDGEKITINFAFSMGSKKETERANDNDTTAVGTTADVVEATEATSATTPPEDTPAAKPSMKMSFGGGGLKPKNGLKKSNALSGKKTLPAADLGRKMTEAERIMREEMENDRKRKGRGGFGEREGKRLKA